MNPFGGQNNKKYILSSIASYARNIGKKELKYQKSEGQKNDWVELENDYVCL